MQIKQLGRSSSRRFFFAPDWRLPELLGPPYLGDPLPSVAFDGNGITHTLNFDTKNKPDVGF